MLNIQKISKNIVKSLNEITNLELSEFESKIKESFENVKYSNIVFIGSNGLLKHDDFAYGTIDLGHFKTAEYSYYVEVKVVSGVYEYPIFSIKFDVKDDKYSIVDVRETFSKQ